MSRLVAIVGRPNVGKSTLFNRLVGSRHAIVNDEAGTTRDRQYGRTDWAGTNFSVIDTGGWVQNSDDIFESEINRQVLIALEEADVILFVVDVAMGIHDLDKEVAKTLRMTNQKKPVLVVANKADNHMIGFQSAEFYELGLGEPYPISSINGSGTGDLLDKVVELLQNTTDIDEEVELPRFAVIGRPNAGKSSLINSFLDENRHIVTDIAGTTRDAVYTEYNKFGLNFFLVDTAGIRKKGKVKEDPEYYSVIRAIRAIENCDVAIALIDATRGIESQDVNILSLAIKNGKGLVVCVNKWDLVEDKSPKAIEHFEEAIRNRLAPFTDFPIIFISALTKQRIFKVLEIANDIYKRRHQKIATHQLNKVLLPLIEETPPPSIKGKYIKIKFVTQLPTAVPSFAFYANLPQWVREPYKRFLENKIRENWDFSGIPMNVFLREK